MAEIVFVPTGEHLSIIEHTDVDPSLKGRAWETAGGEGSGKMRQEQRKIILSARLPNMNSITPANTTIFAHDVPAPVLTGALAPSTIRRIALVGKAADQIREMFTPHRW